MAENKINYEDLNLAEAIEHNRRTVPPGCEPAGPGAISVWVEGRPAPQGSKRPLGAGRPGGKIRMIEMSKKLGPWRAAVMAAFRGRPYGASVLLPYPKGTGVVVKIVFVMPRPVATPKTRATPPAVKKPDVDKLARGVLDGIGMAGNVWADDSQVVTLHAYKRIAELGELTGAMIHVERDPSRCQPACRMLKVGQGGHPGPCMLSPEERIDLGVNAKVNFGGPDSKIT
jgi:crossover junction endodeoxyribonuclease RusA